MSRAQKMLNMVPRKPSESSIVERSQYLRTQCSHSVNKNMSNSSSLEIIHHNRGKYLYKSAHHYLKLSL